MRRQRILILRPDNVGDLLLFSGALKHLRMLYPAAYITLAIKSTSLEMFKNCPYVDSVIPVEKLSWWEHVKLKGYWWHRFERLIRLMNGVWNGFFKQYNLVIYPLKSPQLTDLKMIVDLRPAKVMGVTGCKLRFPDGYPTGLNPDQLFQERMDVSKSDPWQHELLTTLEFLKFLGCKVERVEEILPELWLSPEDKFPMPQSGLEVVLGLFPGGSFREKCWDPTNYSHVAIALSEFNIHYVIFGGEGDREIAAEVASCLRRAVPRARISDFSGRTTLRQLADGISRCNFFFGMDTCGLHFAVASGIPSVGIVGGWHYGRFFPWGNPKKTIFLTHSTECVRCGTICADKVLSCIQGVTPEEAATAMTSLLTARRTR